MPVEICQQLLFQVTCLLRLCMYLSLRVKKNEKVIVSLINKVTL